MFVKVPADFNKPRTMADLTDVGKIVNKFIKHNLLPTRCAAQYVSACNVRLIYCILSGVRINWAHVILLNMCKSKDLAYSSSLTRIFMHFKVPLSCTPLKPGTTLSNTVITKSVSAKRVVTKKSAEAGTSAAEASAAGPAHTNVPRRSPRLAPLVPPSRRIGYIEDHHPSTPEPTPMDEDDTMTSRLKALEAQMLNIARGLKDLKKSAGGQLDKVIDEASDFKFKMCMAEQRIKSMQDEIYEMGDKVKGMGETVTAQGKAVGMMTSKLYGMGEKVKDMGEQVTAYGTAVDNMSSQISKMQEEMIHGQELAKAQMDGVMKSLEAIGTQVSFLFNKQMKS